MLTQAVADARAWTAASVDDPRSWYYPLPDACWAAFEQARRELRQAPRPVTAVRLPDPLRADCARALLPVCEALERGRGFALVQGPTGERLAAQDAQLLYWVVGLGLGRPFAQNVQGTLLYDVRDTRQHPAQV